MGYLSPGLNISIRGGGGWVYCYPCLQITIKVGRRWSNCSPGLQISLGVVEEEGTALLVYKYVLVVGESGTLFLHHP